MLELHAGIIENLIWLRLFCTRRLRLDYGVYPELSGTSFVRSFVRCEFFSSPRIFFSSPRNFFRPRENLGQKSLDRRDQFCPKIVELGAILAIFEPFENWKFTSHFWANSADRPEIHCIIPPIVAQISGRSAEFAKKWRMKFWISGTFCLCLDDYSILMM